MNRIQRLKSLALWSIQLDTNSFEKVCKSISHRGHVKVYVCCSLQDTWSTFHKFKFTKKCAKKLPQINIYKKSWLNLWYNSVTQKHWLHYGSHGSYKNVLHQSQKCLNCYLIKSSKKACCLCLVKFMICTPTFSLAVISFCITLYLF